MNELDRTGDDELGVLPPQRPMTTESVQQLMAHVEAMHAAKQLADALCSTDMVPATYKGKPGNGAAAILLGGELGLNPIQSLQNVFVVHGMPAMYARTAVALVKRHGIVVETAESTDERVTVTARDTRTGQVEQSTWTPERAQRAGFTRNDKYKTEPQAMLWAKAAMEVCRRTAPDVLLGIPYSADELALDGGDTGPQRVQASRGNNRRRAEYRSPAELFGAGGGGETSATQVEAAQSDDRTGTGDELPVEDPDISE